MMSPASFSGPRILSVATGSEAWRKGLRPGDRIVRVGDHDVEDSLAATYALGTGASRSLMLHRDGPGQIRVSISNPEQVLDEIRLEPLVPMACTNHCAYCFCAQNPPHARASLRFRDEDFRMSFLAGSYVTLSAMSNLELSRILRDRMTPLYVTVPATDHGLRCDILGVRNARPLMPTLRELIEGGITLHAQIVVCPGLNDGAVLESTLDDLATLRPGLSSVALVPVGTTRYTTDPRIRRPVSEDLRAILSAARRRNASRTVPWVLPSDEVYVALGRRIPGTWQYGESPQLSTGVGMVRRFLDDFARVSRWRAPRWWRSHRLLLASGSLFAPMLSRCVAALNDQWGPGAEVIGIENRFFGCSVTVAGLLGGAEIGDAAMSRHADALVLSRDTVAHDDARFIDDTERMSLQTAVGMPVVIGELLSDAFSAAGVALGW